MKITYKEMRAKQKRDLKAGISRNMIYRNFSTPFTYLFVRLGISPATVSIVNFIPPLLGFYLLSLGNYVSIVIGLLLFALFKVLDCSDGEIARIQNSKVMEEKYKNIEGPFLDGVAHYIYPICLGMGLGIGTFRLYGNVIYLFLGVILTLLFIQEIALIDLLKGAYRKVIIGRKIRISDKEALQRIMHEIHNGKKWEGQNIFAKLFSMHPFQGLLYTTEFIIPILIILAIAESAFFPATGIIAIYLVIIAIQKLIHFLVFIARIKNRMFITRVIERLQKR